MKTESLIAESKRKQRLAALEARRAIPHEQRRKKERDICRLLTEMSEVYGARVILSYIATAEELSLHIFHNWASRQGKVVAFPVSYPEGRIEAFLPSGPDCLQRGMFGITEPRPDRSALLRPEEIDLVLVPCVAFDGEGRRLGHGGGYYDQYLPRCIRAMKIVPAFEAQRLPYVITDSLDVTVDALVTEEGTWYVRSQ